MNTETPRSRFCRVHALIAEDDALIAFDIEQTLSTHFDIRVSVAHSLTAGLAVLEADPPHVAVLDIDLGGVDIEPLARALDAAGAPIVMVSGHRSHPLQRLAQGLTLEKPHSSAELVAMVAKALARLSG